MAITARAEGTWNERVTSTTVAIPGGATTGDIMYLLASWKDFAITATVNQSFTEVTQFTDGSVATGNGTGSMKVGCWYKEHTGSESNPTLTFSTTVGLLSAAVIIVFQKAGSETWDAPLFCTGALSAAAAFKRMDTNPGEVAGDLLVGILGFRDDSATMTREPTTNLSCGEAPHAGYIEYPATHFSTTTGNDMSCDAGYRIVEAGVGALAPYTDWITSAAETGAGLVVRQRVTAVAGNPPYRNPMPPLLAQ